MTRVFAGMCHVAGWPGSLTAQERAMAKHICAPTVLVPGAYKAASSTLFANIAKHPQILRVSRCW